MTISRKVRLTTARVGLCLWLGACLSGCGAKGEKTAKADAAARPIPVTVTPLQTIAVERAVPMVGTLKGWEEVTVGTRKAGRVVRFLHDMGDRVKPDSPLVELDPVDADLAILQAESTYLGELTKLGISREQAEEFFEKYGVHEEILRGKQADAMIQATPSVQQALVTVEKSQQNLTRQRQLTARNAGTQQELQNMENDAKLAEAQLAGAVLTARTVIASAVASRIALDVARQARADMTIRVPTPMHALKQPESIEKPREIEYAVARRTVSEGQFLREGDAVYDLVIENPLRLWANVPEKFSREIKVGQPVKFTVSSRPDEPYNGVVTRVNPTIDATSRTFQVEASVRNDAGELHPGGFAKASVLTQRDSQAHVVPLESVVRFAGVTKIFIVEEVGGKLVSRSINVETGQEENGMVEVIGDVPPGSNVVITGQTQLADGTSVVIRDPSKPESPEPEATPKSEPKALKK
jgi:multidrug efflux pump subunit AcrA (membrane-fusion protein)